MKKINLKSLVLFFAVMFIGSGFYNIRHKIIEIAQTYTLSKSSKEIRKTEVFPYQIKKNQTAFDILNEAGLSGIDIHQVVEIAKPYFNLHKLKAGTKYQLYNDTEPNKSLTGITFRFSPEEFLVLKKENNIWSAKTIHEPVELKLVTYAGVVTNSLWESADSAGMDPNLISELAEIFAWQVDFAREVRLNDRWRLSVEQRLVHGEPIGWGKIIAAEYINAGEKNTAVLFRQDGKDHGYFAPDGSSLRRMFLKTPMRFGRISSRFQRARFHPILKVRRPHLGVDYAAPTGTPIRAVGDGIVEVAGMRGGGGNTVKIRHNSTYQTAYLHLSRINVRQGARVSQGQIIGLVGTTGLSTAPHLHFEFFQNGSYVDPLGKKFPSAEPIPQTMMQVFLASLQPALQSLPPWPNAGVAMTDSQPPTEQSRNPSTEM